MLVVHICVLSFEGVPLIGAVITPQASDQLPYDIVSMVYDQDMDRVKAVMDTYDVDVQIYPMVRVSSISGNSSLQQDERSVNTEQGAYIPLDVAPWEYTLLLQRTLERQKQRGDANDESAEKRAVPQ